MLLTYKYGYGNLEWHWEDSGAPFSFATYKCPDCCTELTTACIGLGPVRCQCDSCGWVGQLQFTNEVDLLPFIRTLYLVRFQGWKFVVMADGTRPYLQVQCDTRCNATGQPMGWKGRKWFLSPYMTKSEVVGTAFKAVMTAVEHETREQFKYKGQAIFGPHFDVDKLAQLSSQNVALDTRKESK